MTVAGALFAASLYAGLNVADYKSAYPIPAGYHEQPLAQAVGPVRARVLSALAFTTADLAIQSGHHRKGVWFFRAGVFVYEGFAVYSNERNKRRANAAR